MPRLVGAAMDVYAIYYWLLGHIFSCNILFASLLVCCYDVSVCSGANPERYQHFGKGFMKIHGIESTKLPGVFWGKPGEGRATKSQDEGCAQHIARHVVFDNLTILVPCFFLTGRVLNFSERSNITSWIFIVFFPPLNGKSWNLKRGWKGFMHLDKKGPKGTARTLPQ